MKFLFRSVLFASVLMSCSSPAEKKETEETQKSSGKMDFATAFSGVDTTKAGLTVGCSSGEYKLVSDKYVLHFKPYFPAQFDSSYAVEISTVNASQIVELLVYDNNKSSLSSFCSDVVSTDASEPSRRLVATQGNIVVGYSDPTELSGNKTQRLTILVKDLTFTDENTGEKIELKNELLWKVLDIGTPG